MKWEGVSSGMQIIDIPEKSDPALTRGNLYKKI